MELIAERVPLELGGKIALTAGGNPLFIEEMLAVSEGAGDVIVPSTLRAVLAARLDRLEPAERRVLERAAVEGEVFHRGAVQALSPDEPSVTPVPRRARPQGADQARSDTRRGRRRVPLPPPADP